MQMNPLNFNFNQNLAVFVICRELLASNLEATPNYFAIIAVESKPSPKTFENLS